VIAVAGVPGSRSRRGQAKSYSDVIVRVARDDDKEFGRLAESRGRLGALGISAAFIHFPAKRSISL
jgi:hypothetical protein